MQENRWHRIEETFAQAVDLPAAQRRGFVEKICGADEDLCREIIRLVEGDEEADVFLNEPVFTLGAQILEQDLTDVSALDFGHYEIEKLIGRGGMGAVYLARDRRLGRPAAIKILPAAVSADRESTERFRQEARAASAISHPNIAHIYEFGEAEKILEQLKNQHADGEISVYSVAAVEGALGNRDAAFALLEKHFKKIDAALLSIRVDPMLDSLRGDARFERLEANFKFPKKLDF